MYQLSISRDFIAQHYLIGGDWGRENQRHSHHYRVEILLSAEQLDRHGYLIDIVALEQALAEVIEQFRDRVLNELAAFSGLNPSLEHFARIFYESLYAKLQLNAKLRVKIWENADDWAAYCTPDDLF